MSADPMDKVQENGRTYHAYKDGKYILPNDEPEQDRLDLQHEMFTELFGQKLSLAPIVDKKLHNVLDLATGTGIWAIEFAKKYPSAKVLGTDLTLFDYEGAPPTCDFMVADAEDEWLFEHPFDYIHGRALCTLFQDPADVIRKAFDALAPGGFFELQDPIMPMSFASPPPMNSPFQRWCQVSLEASIKGGRPINNVPHYSRWLREAGFVDVEEKSFFLPLGTWKKDQPQLNKVGALQLRNITDAMEGFTVRNLSSRLGWSAEQCNSLIADVREELQSGELHAYNDVLVVWGRKPL